MLGKDGIVAEFIGTFALVAIGGFAVLQADIGNLNLVGVALAHFLVLSIMVYFGGRFSGAHYNPAVTLSFVATRKIDGKTGLIYIITQLVASIFAGIVLLLLKSEDMKGAVSKLGFPHVQQGYDLWMAIFAEALGTFFLVFVIWAVAADKRAPDQIFGFAIGGAVAFSILAIGPMTGAALNPARVFGPALIAADFENHIVYWIGPIIGGLLAGFLYNTIFLKEEEG
ncbi:MAG: aquaporin [Methanobacteriota archaeon]|nr:MAG: aquaporin [Euryarchaeota archaeon]